MKRFYKIISIVLLVAFVATLMPISYTHLRVQKAQAIPVIDAGNIATNLAHIIRDVLIYIVQIAAEALKKRILDMIVDMIIKWIQGGGEPKFVSDWQGFLGDAANQAVGDTAILAGLGFLCSPFNLQIRVGLLPTRVFTEESQCTLDEIVGNIENFYDDFKQGGWIALGASWEVQNNFYGASLLAWEAASRSAAKSEGTAGLEAMSGSGFLSTKKCREDGSGKGQDLDRDGIKGDIPESCTVTTPGQVAGDLISKAIGSDIDFIVNAQDFKAYIAAIADAAINRLITEGVNGLSGIGTSNAPPGGTIKPGPGRCAGLTGKALVACENFNDTDDTAFNDSKAKFIGEVDKALKPRQEARNSWNSSITLLNSYKTSLENLRKQFETANCANKDTFIKEVDDELKWVATKLTEVKKGRDDNEKITSELESIRNRMNAANNVNWGLLSSLFRQFNANSEFAEDKGKASKAKAEAENTSINSRRNTKITQFNQNLTSCNTFN